MFVDVVLRILRVLYIFYVYVVRIYEHFSQIYVFLNCFVHFICAVEYSIITFLCNFKAIIKR